MRTFLILAAACCLLAGGSLAVPLNVETTTLPNGLTVILHEDHTQPQVTINTWFAVGSKDDVAGSVAELAAVLPHARVLDIPGRDHMSAVGDKVHKQGVLDFLRERP